MSRLSHTPQVGEAVKWLFWLVGKGLLWKFHVANLWKNSAVKILGDSFWLMAPELLMAFVKM